MSRRRVILDPIKHVSARFLNFSKYIPRKAWFNRDDNNVRNKHTKNIR